MRVNYHTHTTRCNHASGSEREYVENAIKGGLKVLGFSDHSPYIFAPDRRDYAGFRMKPEETAEYIGTIRALAKEYAGDIQLLAGVEIEYYPKYFERTVRFLGEMDCDYLIMGQHMIGDEETAVSGGTADAKVLSRYVSQAIEGMETGKFAYFAHPDMFLFNGDARAREKEYTRLCEAAKRLNVPLEINMYGMVDNRWYPRADFFRLAGEIGNEIVAGVDAHDPGRLSDPTEWERVQAFAAECGVQITELPVERVLSHKTKIR